MKPEILSIVRAVVEKTDREHPADAALRAELRAWRLFPTDRTLITQAVFAYFRWTGWLDSQRDITSNIRAALELDGRFQKDPKSFSDEELIARAVPEWVRETMTVTPEWVRSLQSSPTLWLRAQPGTGAELANALGDCRGAGDGALSDALRYDGEMDLLRSPEFHEGKFEIQDLSSQVVGLLCDPKPGETWWDACAGEGGKLLHLGGLMQNKGLVWASDRAEWRLKSLKRRAARAKVFNYRAKAWDGGAKPPVKTKFHGILVDAPCSGVGTWGRNPHARWATTANDVAELAEAQKRLLANVIPSLRPGGKLFYSVCTLTRAETTGVAEAITSGFSMLRPLELKNPLESEAAASMGLWLRPWEVGANGMFVAGWTAA